MINLLHLNKFKYFILFFAALVFNCATIFAAEDIWKKKKNDEEQNKQIQEEKEITIESPILSNDINKITINISEQELDQHDQIVVGLFDPEKNNFNLNMWTASDGSDIKNILKRINKLKLSKISEELLFQVLFTNAYPPKVNLNSSEFNKIKINWLIKNRRIEDLETLLISNEKLGNEEKAIKFLVNESLASSNIKSACEKINVLE